MKKIFVFVLFASLAFASPIDSARKASYQIGQKTIATKPICSATAIGPQAILTATHCEAPTDLLFIRGLGHPVEIVSRIRDDFDHTIYFVQGTTFKDFVEVNIADSLEVSEDIFTFGNPADWTDVYQKGYLAGIQSDSSLAAVLGEGSPDLFLFAFQAYSGESGAGIFNQKGQLVGVVSLDAVEEDKDRGEVIAFAGAYKLNFKQEDLDKARTFTTEKK